MTKLWIVNMTWFGCSCYSFFAFFGSIVEDIWRHFRDDGCWWEIVRVQRKTRKSKYLHVQMLVHSMKIAIRLFVLSFREFLFCSLFLFIFSFSFPIDLMDFLSISIFYSFIPTHTERRINEIFFVLFILSVLI